jgi:hypothetical protein
MQKVSIKKLSILGLVLMGASAVAAAVIPNKSDKKPFNVQFGDSITEDSAPGDANADSWTCAPDSEANKSDDACTATSQLGGSCTTGATGCGLESSNGEVSSRNDNGIGANQTTSNNA